MDRDPPRRGGGRQVSDETKAFAFGFVLAALCSFAGYWKWYGIGHEQGVRDALAGKYVVVQLPDGTSVVVENKEARP